MMDEQRNICATEFGPPGDKPGWTAYGVKLLSGVRGVALPERVPPGKIVILALEGDSEAYLVPVIDIGPWNTHDPYWATGTRPKAETLHATRGKDEFGRIPSNAGGIDLTSATMDDLGVQGRRGARSCLVRWSFQTGSAE